MSNVLFEPKHRKLFSADSGGIYAHIFLYLGKYRADAAQTLIALRMAVMIVEVFEKINIGDSDTQPVVVSPVIMQKPLKSLHKIPAVIKLG